MLKCSACGSPRVTVLINGKPYCASCGSKILRMHLVKTLINMKKEGLVSSIVNIEGINDP
ncbi:TFIIB-type zinc finger domain-containing protein [Vulcanisaeta thermophila]|uniref:TFIIB-type zinc finger domain-containing protein n=1 Tax=Vulcanisaeta thermophila TaxID=867917 RepID=UPI000852E426|nr:TFIIB-type zinc finger domain-containing protein [Vulcanisaeta thermophila]